MDGYRLVWTIHDEVLAEVFQKLESPEAFVSVKCTHALMVARPSRSGLEIVSKEISKPIQRPDRDGLATLFHY